MSLEKRIWIRYRDNAEYAKAKAKMAKYKVTYADVYRIGLDTLDERANISGVQKENAYCEAYIYYKEFRNKEMKPWKVVHNKGKKVNVEKIRIYRIDELIDGSLALTYSKDGESDVLMLKRLKSGVDEEIVDKFITRG